MPLPEPFEIEAFVQSRHTEPNRYLGRRFSKDGVFLPEVGNTVVRHVVSGSETELALIELRERLRGLPWGHRFAFTDVPSLHMTVFEGAIETRREPDYWPREMPLDATLEEVTEHLAGRLEGFEGSGPFDMRIFEVTPFGLTLRGATERDEDIARAWRDALTEPFGYRSPNHGSYFFHVTLAYIIDWLPDEMAVEYKRAMAELTREFRQRIPVVELGPPAFCTFTDMNAFPPVVTLPGTGITEVYAPARRAEATA
ncbi:MAG: DUF1868 domain-containing protein [Rhizobiaceae bacterium]|nr:DUF1868 domain-containing protein [Rhizobiaceae bacterium]